MTLKHELGTSNPTPAVSTTETMAEASGRSAPAVWSVNKDVIYTNQETRPSILRPNGAGIPESLKKRPNWVGWRLELDASKKRLTKVPYALNHVSLTGYHKAESDNRGTWVSWEQVRHRYNSYREEPYHLDGIGFEFGPGKTSDGYIGIDLDNCRNPTTGELSPLGRRVIDVLPKGYWEKSPSDTGVKAWFLGKLPDGWTTHKVKFPDGQAIEIFDCGRYFAMTGHRLPEATADITSCAEVLTEFLAEFFPKKPKTSKASKPKAHAVVNLDDAKVIEFITSRSKGADKGNALWNGELGWHNNDQSAADMALVNLLAFYCGGDRGQMDRLFRQSGLMREKWDEARGERTYGEITIDRALDGRTEFWSPSAAAQVIVAAGETDCTGDEELPTGVAVIEKYFRERYRPQFKRGNAIFCTDGETIAKNVACDVPTSELINRLSFAADAPKGKGGGVIRDQLPGFFRKWVSVAWGDLLQSLPDEDTAALESDRGAAREEFRRMVRDAMLTEVVLGESVGDDRNQITRIERRPLIDWCCRFAAQGPWRDIRGRRCWCKIRGVGDAMTLVVAIRHELFGQLRADRRLCTMTANTFTRRAAKYGIGTSTRDDRPHGQTAVVLDPAFVEELIAGLPDDEELATPNNV